MTEGQPFIPTWMTKSGEPFPGNLKILDVQKGPFQATISQVG